MNVGVGLEFELDKSWIYVRNVRCLLDYVRAYGFRSIECERDGSSRDYPILTGYGPRSIRIQLH